jgi:hypothetical protein
LKLFQSVSLVPIESANVCKVSRSRFIEALDLRGEGPDHLRVVEVPTLGGLHHRQVVLDHQRQGVGRRPVEPEALGHLDRQLGAHQFMTSAGVGLAAVVEQQGEVEDERALHPAQQVGVAREGPGLGPPDLVQLGHAGQRVFVDRILVIELVLDEVGHLVELGQESAEQPHLVHGPHRGGHVPTLVEDLQEGRLVVGVGLEAPVHQRDLLPQQLGKVRVDRQAAPLGLQEGP